MLSSCRVCEGSKIRSVVTFENMPIHLWPSRSGDSSESSQLIGYKCENCNHSQLQNLDRDFLNKMYSTEYMNMESGTINLARANYLNDRHDFQSAEILDVGGGTNSTFKYFSNSNFTIVDPHAPTESGAKHIQGFISDAQLEFEIYDFIFAFHIFEHLENPKLDLRKLIHSLKQSGKIVVEVPDSIYYSTKLPHYLYFHQHINLFTVETLDLLFSLEGLRRIDLKQESGRLLATYEKNFTEEFSLITPPISPEYSLPLINSNFFHKIEMTILNSISRIDAKEIILLGAGGSSTLLMYHFPRLLEKIAYFMDSDIRKIGLNLPGTEKEILQFPICPESDVLYLILGEGVLSNWTDFSSAKILDLLPFLEVGGM